MCHQLHTISVHIVPAWHTVYQKQYIYLEFLITSSGLKFKMYTVRSESKNTVDVVFKSTVYLNSLPVFNEILVKVQKNCEIFPWISDL